LRNTSRRSPTSRVPSAESRCAQMTVGLLTLLLSSFQKRKRRPRSSAATKGSMEPTSWQTIGPRSV
jgi:hypothetical protein